MLAATFALPVGAYVVLARGAGVDPTEHQAAGPSGGRDGASIPAPDPNLADSVRPGPGGARVDGGTPSPTEPPALQRSVQDHLLAVSPHLLDQYVSAASKAGVDLSSVVPLPPWESVRHLAYEAFVAKPEEVAEWEADFLAGIPGDGVVTEGFLDQEFGQLLGASDVPLDEAVGRAQEILDDRFVELRAATSAIAAEIASAQQQMWAESRYNVAPMLGIVEDAKGRTPVLLKTTGAQGWAVAYTIYQEDFPRLDEALVNANTLRKSIRRDIALAIRD